MRQPSRWLLYDELVKSQSIAREVLDELEIIRVFLPWSLGAMSRIPCIRLRNRWKSANVESVEILTDQISASRPTRSLVDLWCSRMLPGRNPSLKRDNPSSETLSLSKTHH